MATRKQADITQVEYFIQKWKQVANKRKKTKRKKTEDRKGGNTKLDEKIKI